MLEEDKKDREDASEEASAHKLQKAQKEGQSFFSRDLVQWSHFVIFYALFFYALPLQLRSLVSELSVFFCVTETFPLTRLHHALYEVVLFLVFLLVGLFVVPLGVGLIQIGKALSLKRLQPKVSHLSFVKGAKRLFSKEYFFDSLKNIVRMVILSLILFYVCSFRFNIQTMSKWLFFSTKQLMVLVFSVLESVTIVVVFSYFFIAIFDYSMKRYAFLKKLRMTREELKKEFREMEGNPEIRQKLRELRRQKNNLMQDMKHATVVIINPTCCAVVLSWKEATMNAPLIIAKGIDFRAQRIEKIAQDLFIPIVENAVLSRSLYQLHVNQEITPEYYKIVAEIIRPIDK